MLFYYRDGSTKELTERSRRSYGGVEHLTSYTAVTSGFSRCLRTWAKARKVAEKRRRVRRTGRPGWLYYSWFRWRRLSSSHRYGSWTTCRWRTRICLNNYLINYSSILSDTKGVSFLSFNRVLLQKFGYLALKIFLVEGTRWEKILRSSILSGFNLKI